MPWFIPLLIFLARIADVSLGTTRMIFVINGHRYIAAVLGFFEVLIWALAVGGVLHYLENPIALVSYAAGFAAGTLVGMEIEQRIAIGYRMIQVFNRDLSVDVCGKLRSKGLRVTYVPAQGLSGAVEMAHVAVKRKELHRVLEIIRNVAPDAFVTVQHAERATVASLVRGQHRVGLGRWRRFLAVRK